MKMGTVSGGPMYYLTKGFAERGLPGGRFLAILFSVFCILGAPGGGNMFQANQAHQQICGIVGGYPGWISGIIFAIVVFAVIVGGLKSIARVTEKVAPFMGDLYVGAAANLGPVIDFSDAAIFAMAMVNIIGLYCLMPIVKIELNSNLSRLESGEIKQFK